MTPSSLSLNKEKDDAPGGRSPVVELGYLTVEGCLVVADSLGHRTLFKAYRLREKDGYAEILGLRRQLEKVADARVTVTLHRQGWAGPAEVLLRDSPCRLYRGKTRHYAFGPDWESLVRRDWYVDPIVTVPWFSGGGAKGSPAKPRPGSPFVVMFADPAVKGCAQSGSKVELYAMELKEFTDFVLGKLRATITFASESEAGAFAKQFPVVADVAALDAAVKVEIDRSRKVKRPKRKPGQRRVRRKMSKRGQRQLAFMALLIMVEAVAIAASGLPATSLVLLPVTIVAGIAGGLSLVWRQSRVRNRVERLDLAAKFPAKVWERFAAQAPGLAGGFVYMLKDHGIELNPTVIDLAPMDAFLRGLPPDTRYGGVTLAAGAFLGQAFLAGIGRKVPSRWVWVPKEGLMALQIQNAHWVSPLTWVAKVWDLKTKETLHDYVDTWTAKVRSALAYGHRATFTATGFAPTSQYPEALVERVAKDVESVAPESFVLGDRHIRRRRLAYGPFTLDLVEGELLERRGPGFIPLIAIPFVVDAPELRARLDGAAPHVPNADDVAVLRLSDAPLVALGVQIRNYVEVGPSFGSPDGEVTLRLLAVADKVEVVTPRMRETRPELKDFLVPLAPREDGMPTSSYATVVGRITTVDEMTNPVTNLALWRLRLDVSGLPLTVLVRKDRCPALPTAGSYANGNLWLVGDLVADVTARPDYIR